MVKLFSCLTAPMIIERFSGLRYKIRLVYFSLLCEDFVALVLTECTGASILLEGPVLNFENCHLPLAKLCW